jgi:hypothetical protein
MPPPVSFVAIGLFVATIGFSIGLDADSVPNDREPAGGRVAFRSPQFARGLTRASAAPVLSQIKVAYPAGLNIFTARRKFGQGEGGAT